MFFNNSTFVVLNSNFMMSLIAHALSSTGRCRSGLGVLLGGCGVGSRTCVGAACATAGNKMDRFLNPSLFFSFLCTNIEINSTNVCSEGLSPERHNQSFQSIFPTQQDYQRINHYPNHFELTRKDLLMKNLKRAKRQFERTSPAEAAKYEFFPTTYLLPNEYNMFVEVSAFACDASIYDEKISEFLFVYVTCVFLCILHVHWTLILIITYVACTLNRDSCHVIMIITALHAQEFKKQPSGSVWIMKPIGRAQGKGTAFFLLFAASLFLFVALFSNTRSSSFHSFLYNYQYVVTYRDFGYCE